RWLLMGEPVAAGEAGGLGQLRNSTAMQDGRKGQRELGAGVIVGMGEPSWEVELEGQMWRVGVRWCVCSPREKRGGS
ncbi:MAG: hypothetical protein LQ340_007812, partial [Diploschistes diacapsis]